MWRVIILGQHVDDINTQCYSVQNSHFLTLNNNNNNTQQPPGFQLVMSFSLLALNSYRVFETPFVLAPVVTTTTWTWTSHQTATIKSQQRDWRSNVKVQNSLKQNKTKQNKTSFYLHFISVQRRPADGRDSGGRLAARQTQRSFLLATLAPPRRGGGGASPPPQVSEWVSESHTMRHNGDTS